MKIIKKLFCFTFALLTASVLLSNNAYASDTMGTMIPIHSYTFDTDAGTTVLDCVTGSAINGTITGASRITGYDGTGNAIHFNGNNYISFTNKVIPAGEKSISFYIRKNSTTEIGDGAGEYIFGNQYDSLTQYGTVGYISKNGRLTIACSNAGLISFVTSSISVCDNNWHKILFTWDGTMNANTFKLYIDDMSTPNSTATSKFVNNTPANYNLYIGSLAQAKGTYKFVGDIDQFEVYSSTYLNTPSGIAAVANQENKQINVSWSVVPSAMSYNIYRSDTPGSGYSIIGSSTTNSFLDSDPVLTTGKTYYYVVTSVNANFESEYSSEASATIMDTSGEPEITGDRAILVITTTLGTDKEYDLSASEINAFLNWYDAKSSGSGRAYFAITKHSNVKPFINRKEYINYSSIENFEVKDYYEK